MEMIYNEQQAKVMLAAHMKQVDAKRAINLLTLAVNLSLTLELILISALMAKQIAGLF